jgi:hypothetical protein
VEIFGQALVIGALGGLLLTLGFLLGLWSQRMVVARYKQYLTWEHDTTEQNIQEVQKLLPANVAVAQYLLGVWLEGVRQSGFRTGDEQ